MEIQGIELEELAKRASEGDEEAFKEIAKRAEGGDRKAASARERILMGVSTYDRVEGNFPWT